MSDENKLIELCSAADIPDDSGKYVLHNERAYAVVRGADGGIRVMDDTCPHAAGSLSEGMVHQGCLVCPWHGWAFDVQTGACPDNPSIQVRTYETHVENGRVFARLPQG